MEDEMIERAKELAELTGRDLEDVLADLADDGILNQSNKEDKDLISQLKEAAELINTVQEINKEVSENTVLNGGNNKTEVAIDTTLEGDIVDRAIASAHRKVVELKKIALIIAPVFLLVSGGSLEALGIINLMGSEEDDEDDWEEPYVELWGCTDWEASNYNELANMDDGSCEYDVYGCTNDAASNYDPMATIDDGSCEPEPEPIKGCMDDEAENYDPEAEEDDGSCYYPPPPKEGCTDPDADNYDSEAEEDDGSCEYPADPDDCTVEIHNHYRGHADNDPASTTMIVAFKLVPTDCDDFTVFVRIELFQAGQAPAYVQEYQLDGDKEHDISHAFNDMAAGTWTPKILAGVEGELKADVNFWSLDIQASCDGAASFYNSSYSVEYNNSNQFWVSQHNSVLGC